LRRGGEPCKTEPKVFDLLVFLAHHPHQVFSHEALIEEVWSGRPVAETTISTCVKQARRLRCCRSSWVSATASG
jgi:DNA-binding winged helix-turn-helix (wHTH) protein